MAVVTDIGRLKNEGCQSALPYRGYTVRGVFAKILEIMIDFGPPVSAADNVGGALNVVGMGISGARILATPAPRTQNN